MEPKMIQTFTSDLLRMNDHGEIPEHYNTQTDIPQKHGWPVHTRDSPVLLLSRSQSILFAPPACAAKRLWTRRWERIRDGFTVGFSRVCTVRNGAQNLTLRHTFSRERNAQSSAGEPALYYCENCLFTAYTHQMRRTCKIVRCVPATLSFTCDAIAIQDFGKILRRRNCSREFPCM